MRNIEKNRKQRFTHLPISIGWFLRIGLVVAGFCLWGSAFIGVLLGLWLGWSIIKGILSCLLSLMVLIAFILLLVVIIF